MKAHRAFFLIFVFILLAACDANTSGDSFDSPRVIANDEGSALLLEATRAALRVVSERKTATIQHATMSAASTREFVERAVTGTAQALKVRAQEMSLNATANAVGLQQQQTRQAATETSEARRSEATATQRAVNIAASETSMQHARNVAASQTADAIQATATTFAATSTRGAQELQAALERKQATATAEQLEIRRVQAQEDAARSQAWNDFFDSLMKIVLGIGAIAALVMLIVQVARYLDVLAMRQRLVETRSGTVMIVVTNGKPEAQIIKPTPNLLDAGQDEFEASQLPAVTNQADDEMLKVTTTRGETFIAKNDPQEELAERNRKLALRLLRESMRYYANKQEDGPNADRIPGHRVLGWSGETWSRAILILRPYIVTREGRGGGTFCGARFPTLMQLYSAIGERRVSIAPIEPRSPTPEIVANAA